MQPERRPGILRQVLCTCEIERLHNNSHRLLHKLYPRQRTLTSAMVERAILLNYFRESPHRRAECSARQPTRRAAVCRRTLALSSSYGVVARCLPPRAAVSGMAALGAEGSTDRPAQILRRLRESQASAAPPKRRRACSARTGECRRPGSTRSHRGYRSGTARAPARWRRHSGE